MVVHWDWFGIGVGACLLLAMVCFVCVKIGTSVITAVIRRRRAAKWAQLTKNSDKLILHCPPPARTIPSPSPFVMKVLAYLRMAGIPYDVDHTAPFGGKGKTPWISLGGENYDDSEFILSFLVKKYGRTLTSTYTDEQLAVATAIRIMLDEHFFWGWILERFVYGDPKNSEQVFPLPFLIRIGAKSVVKSRSDAQGLGLHREEDVVAITSKDLRVVSQILGHKKFILGDEPCIEDAGIFGQLSQACWGLPNSPYERLLNGECKNIREYCFRVRELYFPDWK